MQKEDWEGFFREDEDDFGTGGAGFGQAAALSYTTSMRVGINLNILI